MAKPKQHRDRIMFPWEYDAQTEAERKAGRLKGRRRQKAMTKLERARQRARRAREDRNRPLSAGQPKIIRPWPQGWRVPTATRPMTAKEYALYLTLPHWQRFNQAYRQSDTTLHACFVCGSDEFELHHHSYARLGCEEFADVVPLCRVHHRAVHKAVKAGVKLMSAHTYVKIRYQRGELGLKQSVADT